MLKLSIIISVLDSHEVVRRQILNFRRMTLPNEVEIILVDDGSSPPIDGNPYCHNLRIIQTNDQRAWSQPCARNYGAAYSVGEYLLMTDIDHILSKEAILSSCLFNGDKMMFPREWGILDSEGCLSQKMSNLAQYGLKLKQPSNGLSAGCHTNTFTIRRKIFEELCGYNEKFCGKYGGDDVDLSNRYGELHKLGKVSRHVIGPKIYVYPDPRQDVMGIFHQLRQNKTKGGK